MTSQDNDEITIDFSGITSWFKSKKKPDAESKSASTQASAPEHHTPHSADHHTTASSDDTEISLDLSRITRPFSNFFGSKTGSAHGSSHRSESAEIAGKDEGIAITWDGVKNFAIRWHLLLLLLIPMFIAYDLRIQTVDLPITEQWARDTIHSNIRNQITATVARSYPNLPEAQRSELVTEQFNKIIAEQKDTLENQIKSQAAYFKSRFNDEHGHTVLLDIDSYAYFRETRNLLENGHLGNTIINGTDWDTFIMAPLGVPSGKNLQINVGVWQYKLWKLFDKDIYLMKSTFYLPMIVYVLAVIPAYMIATYYGGAFAGVVAGIILAIHPAVLTRTSAGVTDTDVWQVFFPLWVIWIYLEAFRRKTNIWRLIVASLAGVTLGVYSLAWSGWWLIFYFIVIVTILHVIAHVFRHRTGSRINLTAAWKHSKQSLQMLALFILFTGIFVTWLRNFNFFIGFITQPFAFLALKQASNANLWPNVYTTVAELNPISIQGAISQISFGSNLLFALAVLGILLTLTKRDEEGHLDVKLFALLALWFGTTLWASKSGVRFVGLAVPAFSLAVGACFGLLALNGSQQLKKHLRIPELASRTVIIIMLSLLLIAPVKAGYQTATHNIPLISDAWWQTLTQIRDTAPKDAIITSWWDFGHWFKAVADRPVTFDGGTQNTPIAHWVGKILLTADEEQAVGILRMLNCGSYQAAPELEAQGLATIDAVKLLYSVFNKTREEALAAYIQAGIPHPESVLSYTHCTPPASYVITSADMVGKSGVWAHFGSWDFKRSAIWLDRNNGTFEQRVADIQRLGFTQTESENLQREVQAIREEGEANSWISPWPSYGGGTGCTKSGEILNCQNGLIVNLTTMDVIYSGETSPIHGLIYVDGEEVKQKTYPKYSQDVSIALVPAGDGLQGIFMQYPLGKSMFTRLFYLEGHGLKHFKRVSDRTSVIGERIINWKVDWAGNETNIYYPLTTTQNTTATIANTTTIKNSTQKTTPPKRTVRDQSNGSKAIAISPNESVNSSNTSTTSTE